MLVYWWKDTDKPDVVRKGRAQNIKNTQTRVLLEFRLTFESWFPARLCFIVQAIVIQKSVEKQVR